MNSPVRLGVSPAAASIPTGGLGFYFPVLEPWVVQSVSFPSCSSQFIFMRMWDHPVCQLLPCRESSLTSCLSPPLLPVWMNVSSLTPWLLDFHTVQFSVSFGCFLFLNLLLSFFWSCEESQCVYLRLHLGRKSESYLSCNKEFVPFDHHHPINPCTTHQASTKQVLVSEFGSLDYPM